ncbi:homeobox protein 4-like [Leptidea sinapis]|uniref:homeobox protein 4-like n=1 Tax=Leptidea sinapis TaxID=189913 RepID=UPI002145AEF2|nr:homeobox protein 4-like [Leptidea sinapis]XP_050668555.1 homeobox protein 4-like [Leptidea sinapis]
MECDDNGRNNLATGRRSGYKRKCRLDDARNTQLAFTNTMLGDPTPQSARRNVGQSDLKKRHCDPPPRFDSFMSNMDEITYWVYTKRAPCLYNYDQLKVPEEAQTSKLKPISIYSDTEDIPAPKKKKKNNKLLESSNSSSKHQNIYFETSQAVNNKQIKDKLDSQNADLITNIRQTKAREPKRKSHPKTPNRRTKFVTSTPIAANLRRSLRLHQQSNNNNEQLDSSFEIFNACDLNGAKNKDFSEIEHQNIINNITERDHIGKKNNIPNGQYDEYSDVSGFTANYIRSTKLNSKTPKKVKMKSSRNLMQESRQNLHLEGSRMITSVSKHADMQNSAILNHSMDSSQNIINLNSFKNTKKSAKTNCVMSLKFNNETNTKSKIDIEKQNQYNNKDSFQSISCVALRCSGRNNNSKCIKKSEPSKGTHAISDLNDDSNNITYRTRSRRRQGEHTCVNDLDTNLVVLNIATPQDTKRKKSLRCSQTKLQKSAQLVDNSTNDGNGIMSDKTQCVEIKKCVHNTVKMKAKETTQGSKGVFFSDSDSDCDVSPQKKFFCD